MDTNNNFQSEVLKRTPAPVVDWENLAREAGYQAAKLARLRRVSLRQLERQFLLESQCTPKQWINKLRLRRAKELLALGWRNKEVAFELGLQPSYFNHLFKQCNGATPRIFGKAASARSSS